jgi:hypothetical protein
LCHRADIYLLSLCSGSLSSRPSTAQRVYRTLSPSCDEICGIGGLIEACAHSKISTALSPDCAMLFHSRIASLAIGSLVLVSIASASHVETFSDANCTTPLTDWNGPNGYPNGLCTSVSKNGNWSSFRIVNLNRGCASTWLHLRDCLNSY